MLFAQFVQREAQVAINGKSYYPDVLIMIEFLRFVVERIVSVDDTDVNKSGLIALPRIAMDGIIGHLQNFMGYKACFLLQLS